MTAGDHAALILIAVGIWCIAFQLVIMNLSSAYRESKAKEPKA